ncbi:MAG: PilZ domain-containing protein [Deltaproteobacteria bacterium]
MLSDIRPNDEIYLRLAAEDVRRSNFIKFLDDNRIAVEQTRPAIASTDVMSLIFFTYCPEKQKNHRFGFQARIESITPDQMVFLRQLTKPFVCDLRLWPRIPVDVLPTVHAFFGPEEIQVIDISGGGTHLALPESDNAAPAVGSLVQVKFVFEQGETTVDGRILRSWMDVQGLRHVEVNFIGESRIRSFIYK